MKKKKTVSYKRHQERKRRITGKKVIGIDPAKEKHQVAVLEEQGIQMGESFSINGPGNKIIICVSRHFLKKFYGGTNQEKLSISRGFSAVRHSTERPLNRIIVCK